MSKMPCLSPPPVKSCVIHELSVICVLARISSRLTLVYRGGSALAWILTQFNESITSAPHPSSLCSILSPPTILICLHDFLLEQTGGGTAIRCERVDRLEPSGTAGAQGRAPRKAPAQSLPRREGWEDRSWALALLQLGVVLAHSFRWCLPSAACFDDFCASWCAGVRLGDLRGQLQ